MSVKRKRPLAKLRVCASCEWIFNIGLDCPQCQFGATYGARSAYGTKAYVYHRTQQPWINRQLGNLHFIAYRNWITTKPQSRTPTIGGLIKQLQLD